MPKISLIVAMAQNGVIGLNNALPWHLPEDLKRFRALTTGHHIIMGRKTYESLGRLLPNRTTVIVTRNKDYKIEGALIAHSLESAISSCADDEEVFIIGGAELYRDALSVAQRLYITEINLEVEGDAFFPDFDKQLWQEINRETHLSESQFEGKNLRFNYVTYDRRTTD